MPEKKTPSEIVDELTYRNYAWNRTISSEITPEQWSNVYGDVAAMEARYQDEGYPTHTAEVTLW